MKWGWIKPEWLIRRLAADLLVGADTDSSAANLERLERWRAADPRHAEALRKAEAVLGAARFLGVPPAHGRRGTASGPALRPRRLALAASIAAVMLVPPAVLLLLSRPPTGAGIQAVMLETGPGETRRVVLVDGSAVTLGSSSAVRVELAGPRREAIVEHGRAELRIRRGSSSFRVRAGSMAAVLDEGIIDVVQAGGDSDLRLIEGSARFSAPGAGNRERTVKAPAALHSSRFGRTVSAHGDVARGSASFDNVRLADVVRWANHSSARQIRVSDPAVAELRVTGVYGGSDAAALARSLADAFGLKVRVGPDGNVGLERPPGR